MKSILTKLLRCSRVEMDGERIQDQMVDIHIHVTLTPEPVLMARGKSLYLGPCPSLELRASSGLSQRNELGAYACVYVCMCTHVCIHFPSRPQNASPEKEGKDSGMAKNSRRQPQSKCVFPGLVPANPRDPSIFFFGFYPGGLMSVC